jgi:histidinol-phosphate aminotransferase
MPTQGLLRSGWNQAHNLTRRSDMANNNYRSFIRPHLENMPPYTPIEPFDVLSARLSRTSDSIIKLDANENPYGPSPAVREALSQLKFPHIYPDPESRTLRAALSSFTGVPEKYLIAGAGADELIDLILRVFLEPGDYVLNFPPTFGIYPFDTQLNAGQLIEIPRKAEFKLDMESIQHAVKQHSPKILFLASPNNPDGSMIPQEEFEQLLDLPIVIVLDEAYVEFSGQGRLGDMATRMSLVPKHDNLIVLRTFSKWAGLAGLRVGYGAFPEWLLPTLWKSKQPYNVNVAASVAAIASLEDLDFLSEQVMRLCRERDLLFQELQSFAWLHAYPSRANFVLCQVFDMQATELKSWLAAKHGILVRYFNTPLLTDHIRVSAGRPEEMRQLISALHEV